MKFRNPFKKKRQWFEVGGYLFNRYMIERVTTIERVQKNIDKIMDITVHWWELWIHFRDIPSQHLVFPTEKQAHAAYDDLCKYVQEVQS